jgi:UDPglucose 6-dehydrogenase
MVMKISVIGAGYVGLVTAITLVEKGHDVICVDIDKSRVNKIKHGSSPFFEPGLDDALKACLETGKFKVSGEIRSCKNSQIVMFCINTPSNTNGNIDLKHLENACHDLAGQIQNIRKNDYFVIVVKSTVLPGTTLEIVRKIIEKYSGLKFQHDFGLCMNPEFLQEGAALQNARKPDKIVIGCENQKDFEIIDELYSNFKTHIVHTDIKTAEMVKYANNAFLATKISFANEMAKICDFAGVDVYNVMDIISLDTRIERKFLNAGPGFGGSCFPKDLRALSYYAKKNNIQTPLINDVLHVNDEQPIYVVEQLESVLKSYKKKRIAILGLAFKGGTDDVRESRAIPIAIELKRRGAMVVGYDPMASINFSKIVDIEIVDTVNAALHDADACIIQADWMDFSKLQERDFECMKNKIIFDTRRILKENFQEAIILRIGANNDH